MEVTMTVEPYNVDRNVYDVVRDTGRIMIREVFGENREKLGSYDPLSNALKCQIWPGDDQPPVHVHGLEAVWEDASSGKYSIRIPPLDTCLDTAIYSIRVVMDDIDGLKEVYRGKIRIVDAPGCYPDKLKVYCSYRDLLDKAPWIDTLQTDMDRSGFMRQRSAAKSWIDMAIIKRSKVLDDSWHDSTNYLYYGVVPPNFAYSSYVAKLISDGKIMVDDTIKSIAAAYTVHLICETQFSPSGAYGPYLEISRRMYGSAAHELETAIIHFDANSDGLADLHIEIGRVSGRGRS
jgi:hypothetical protein